MSKTLINGNDSGGAILVPARVVNFDFGRKTHGVSDDILGRVGAHVRSMVISHAGPRAEYCIVRSGGKGAHIPIQPWQRAISDSRRLLIRDLTVAANCEVAYNGFWVFAWSDADHPTQLVGIWFDGDGDEHVTWDEERPWFEMKRFGIDNYCRNLDESIKIWAEHVQDVELAESQLVKAALGQESSDT